MKITLLDGPMGTQLIEQGYDCSSPAWSAQVLHEHPEAVHSMHCAYASAGATVHTSNTFRTQETTVGEGWADMAQRAVDLARTAARPDHRVAGSIAPLCDCYRPDLSPPNPGPQHAQLATTLANSGVDILLCETFPHIDEALSAVQAAVDTGTETWVSFTAGPDATLLTPEAIHRGAERAIQLGAECVLINCIPATQAQRFLEPLTGLSVPFGVYANAGHPEEGIGWTSDPDGPARYADHASEWVEMGASVIGSCCGTGPRHIEALHKRFCARN